MKSYKVGALAQFVKNQNYKYVPRLILGSTQCSRIYQTFFRSLKNSGKFKSIGRQQYKDFKDKIVDHYKQFY